MNKYLKNWRTTLYGIGAICTAVGDIIYQMKNKEWDVDRLGADIAAIITGLGLIEARDARVSEAEHREDRREMRAAVEEVK